MRGTGGKTHYYCVSTKLAAVWLATAVLWAETPPAYLVQPLAGSDYIGDGGPANAALLNSVQGVAADALGNYYIADTDAHRIRKIRPDGIILTFAGTGRPGYSGDGGPATSAQLNLPYGLAADWTGNIYVADFGNQVVRKISPDGRITTVAGNTPQTKLAGPRNLATDTVGNLYISDFLASRVYKLTPWGGFTAIAGSMSDAALGDGSFAASAKLNNPAGIAVDLSGNVFIADSGNHRIRRISPSNGVISSITAGVVTPVGLTVTLSNQLYVADAGAGQMLRVTNALTDSPVTTPLAQNARDVAADYSANLIIANGNTVVLYSGSSFRTIAGGHDYFLAGDEASPVLARMNAPLGLVRDTAATGGNLYFADSGNHRIRRIGSDGLMHTVAANLNQPSGLALDGALGNLYFTDAASHVVAVVKLADGSITTIAGTTGKKGFSGDGGPAASALLSSPSGICFDGATGRLYVSDEGNNRVRVITPDGNIQTYALAQAPAGLAIGAFRNLYIAESGAGRLTRVGGDGFAYPVAPELSLWKSPRGLTVAPDGSLFVADAATARITRIAADGTVSPAAGTGAQDFGGDGGPGPAASFTAPSGLAADEKGVVYVSDTGNNRIRMLVPQQSAAGGGGNPVLGSLQLAAVVNDASRLAGPVAPGEWITILGTGIEQMSIQVNSVDTPAISAKPGEATVAVPDTAASSGTLEIQALLGGVPQMRASIALAASAIGVYAGSVLNQDGTPNSITNPAARGASFTVTGTGEGRSGLPVTASLGPIALDVLSMAPSDANPQQFTLQLQIPYGYFGSGSYELKITSGAGVSVSQPGVLVWVR